MFIDCYIVILCSREASSSTQNIRTKLSGANITRTGLGSNGVTVTKFLQLLMILELYLELSYSFSQISIVVTVTEVTKVP